MAAASLPVCTQAHRFHFLFVSTTWLELTPLPRPFQGSVVSATPGVLLSSMTTEAVCERVRQMEGIDQSMMGQYSATIRKV